MQELAIALAEGVADFVMSLDAASRQSAMWFTPDPREVFCSTVMRSMYRHHPAWLVTEPGRCERGGAPSYERPVCPATGIQGLDPALHWESALPWVRVWRK